MGGANIELLGAIDGTPLAHRPCVVHALVEQRQDPLGARAIARLFGREPDVEPEALEDALIVGDLLRDAEDADVEQIDCGRVGREGGG